MPKVTREKAPRFKTKAETRTRTDFAGRKSSSKIKTVRSRANKSNTNIGVTTPDLIHHAKRKNRVIKI